MNNKGQTTVLFSLIISILFLFTLTVFEIGRINMATVKIAPCVHSMRSSIMADYNEELFERYHLLFMDPTYGTGSEAIVEEKAMDYLDASLNGGTGGGLYQFTIEEIAITDKTNILSEDMAMLKQQIAEYEQSVGAITHVFNLAKELTGKNSNIEEAAEETVVKGTALPTSDTKEKDKSHDVTDPRDVLKNFLKSGLLAFVLSDSNISTETYHMKNLPSENYREEKKEERDNGFRDIQKLNLFLENSVENETVNALTEHASFASYVMSHFSNYRKKVEDSVIRCEVEYIIAGKDNDYDNLEAVINEITWIRMPINYAYLLTDVEKKSQALTAATGICIATGTEPFIEIVKYLLLGCWAYGESLSETKQLLSGEEVPYIKTSENWYTDLETLTAVNNVKKQGGGLSYEEYLMLLLAMKCGDSLNNGYARILDVIQWNLQKETPAFHITDCVGKMTIQGKVVVNTMFYNGGNPSVYDYYFEEIVDYTE